MTLRIDHDHQIGHSYLLNINSVDDLHFAWYHRIIPLLQEYFYNDGERLRAVLGKEFVLPVETDSQILDDLGENSDFESSKFEVVQIIDDQFTQALLMLANYQKLIYERNCFSKSVLRGMS